MIGDRIEEYRLRKAYKVTELANIVGISHGSLSDIKNGKTEPRADTLEKFIRHTDICAHWLLTGEGPMVRADITSTVPSNDVASNEEGIVRVDDPEMEELVRDLVDILKSNDTVMKKAITENIKAFKESVSRKTKLERSEFETDFKIQGTSRVSRQPGEKHRAGGK